MASPAIFAPNAATQFQQPMTVRNYEWSLQAVQNMPIWEQHRLRLQLYETYWRFYKGSHWPYAAPTGQPNVTVNYTEKFVDLHNTYLFGKGFNCTSDFMGRGTNQAIEDTLNEEWTKNYRNALGWEMGQVGGITGDCWVHVGYDVDPVMGERVKLTVIPSQYCFPVFRHATSKTFDAFVMSWPDTEVTTNRFGRITSKSVRRGQYWTKDEVIDMENDEPVGKPRKNLLQEIPFVHMSNIPVTGYFWGKSDIASVVDLNRELNEKYTDASDIVNYHAAPVTVLYGAKVQTLQIGANRVWSGLPVNSKAEILQAPGIQMAIEYLNLLRDTLFQVGEISPNAFGGVEAISNTSGVALAMQFAPMINHMNTRRLNYTSGIQRINYLVLKTRALIGTYSPSNSMPFYSDVQWPSPLPRDAQMELQNMQQFHAMQLLSRVQMLRALIQERIAPEFLKENKADELVQQAMDEELKWEEQATLAATPPPVEESPSGAVPSAPPQRPSAKGITNNTASAEKRSSQVESAARSAIAS